MIEIYLWPVPTDTNPSDVRLRDPTQPAAPAAEEPPTYSWIGIPKQKVRKREELIAAGRLVKPSTNLPEIFPLSGQKYSRPRRQPTPVERLYREHFRSQEQHLLSVLNDLRIDRGMSRISPAGKKRIALPASLRYYYIPEDRYRWRAWLDWLRRQIQRFRRRR